MATTEQENAVSGENPVTVCGPDWGTVCGREEGEGEQERI